MKPNKKQIQEYLKINNLKEEDLSAAEIINLYHHGTIVPLNNIVFIPQDLYDKIEEQTKTENLTVDQKANRLLEKSMVA